MAATATAMLQSQPGQSVVTAWPQVTPNGIAGQNLDLIQIISASGNSILLNVDFQGVVHNPALNPTSSAGGNVGGDTRVGSFQSRLPAGSSTAQFFADAFSNPSQLDILQVVNVGGNVSYFLDFKGVAHGS